MKYNEGEIVEKIKNVPLHQRQTIRTLAIAISVPKSTLFEMIKRKWIYRHSSSIKPLLTQENMMNRLKFCLSFINSDGYFHNMMEYVHIDEKWFYLTKLKQNFYLVPCECVPYRDAKSNRFITKVMFMAAVARPRYDYHRKSQFDGKIGIWPFTFQEPTRDEIRKMLVENVIPAIKEKMPKSGRGKTKIIIQQDNTKPHTLSGDRIIDEVLSCERFDISLVCQPPNSPDFNVLDLGFFNSIQALQHQNNPKTIDDLVACTNRAFNDLHHDKLNDMFLSLQTVMESSMKCGGGNKYNLKHLHKERMRREGTLPLTLKCSEEVINYANNILREPNNSSISEQRSHCFDMQSALDCINEISSTLNVDLLVETMDPIQLTN